LGDAVRKLIVVAGDDDSRVLAARRHHVDEAVVIAVLWNATNPTNAVTLKETRP